MILASLTLKPQKDGRDAPMLSRLQRVKLSVDTSLTLCLQTLKSRNFQTTIFGSRRLLCVKRSQQGNCVLNIELLIEAFSRNETTITISGNVSDPSLQWEVIGEVFSIADMLADGAIGEMQQPAAFAVNSLQVCIV